MAWQIYPRYQKQTLWITKVDHILMSHAFLLYMTSELDICLLTTYLNSSLLLIWKKIVGIAAESLREIYLFLPNTWKTKIQKCYKIQIKLGDWIIYMSEAFFSKLLKIYLVKSYILKNIF
jgi:hypothetical protein